MTVSRSVVFLAFDQMQVLDLTGPYEVFQGANVALAGRGQEPGYTLSVVSAAPGRIQTSGGIALFADPLPAATTRVDTLVIPGGNGARRVTPEQAPLVAWVKAAAPHIRRLATVCTGAFLAGRVGLIDGRRVATHWSRTSQLQAEFPAARVDPDRLYLRDGELWSSGGVTAGIDLALALVEDDHDAELAQLVARHLVMSWRRPGGQSQYAVPMWAPRGTSSPIVRAQDRVDTDPGADHRVGTLAAAVGMSERNFARAFGREVGQPPAQYVESVRVQAARNLLENDNRTVSSIAARCGFGTAETMRRTFIRNLGVSPDSYRDTFGAHPTTARSSS